MTELTTEQYLKERDEKARKVFEELIDYLGLDFTWDDGYVNNETRKFYTVYRLGVSEGVQSELRNQMENLPAMLRFQAS